MYAFFCPASSGKKSTIAKKRRIRPADAQFVRLIDGIVRYKEQFVLTKQRPRGGALANTLSQPPIHF